VTERAAVVALDKARVWHPYTAMDVYLAEVDPIVVARAEGSRLFDADGTAYLDGNASWWTASLGHRHPRIVRAIERQLATLDHCALAGIAHEPAARLAEELCAVAPPGLSRVFYTDNGSTSVEAAVKMCVQLFAQAGRPEKMRFVALEGAFHGDTIGAASLGGVEVFRRPFAGVVFDCVHVPVPEKDAHARAFADVRRIVEAEHESLAAVVVEPVVQGAAGMRIYDAAYLRELRALCDRHDVLLVFDEVFTGYGRTGPMWAGAHAGVSPDLMCLGKAFAQCMPMGATLVTERVFGAFRGARDRAFYYGHTFCGNPLGAAVAREVLATYRDEDVLGQVRAKAPLVARALERIGRIPGVSRTRALGMVGAADLEEPSGRVDARDSIEESGYLGTRGWRVYDEARKRGAYLRPLGDTVYLCPPLTIAEEDLERLLAILEESIHAALA
jgi:adenosylmethionine-8-amino-7-oxononanoate aminotransferase